MTEKEKIILAQIQVDNLTSLLEDNEWKIYLYGSLAQIKYELDRQYLCLTETHNYTTLKQLQEESNGKTLQN